MTAVGADMAEVGVCTRFIQKSFKNILLYSGGREGQIAAGDPLCQSNDVGLNTPMFVPKHLAQPTKPAHHFVKYQENAVAITNVPQNWQVLIWRHNYTAARNYRFNDNCSNALRTLVEHGVLDRRCALDVARPVGFAEGTAVTIGRGLMKKPRYQRLKL